MRKLLIPVIFLACVPIADAASCRAGTAAQAGSEAGYNRAKAAADAWAQRQQSVTASLGDCLGNISTTITSPVFPNLLDMLNQVAQKICKSARDKINNYVPSTIDPWGDLPTASLSSYTLQPVQSQAAPVQVQTLPQVATTTTESAPRGKSFISLN